MLASKKNKSIKKILNYNDKCIRNIGIIAHVDAGKTTTTEKILFHTGKIHKFGNVDDSNTHTDFLEEEKKWGITICSAATTCFYDGKQINLIDTPGHADFNGEVEWSLWVIDGTISIFCAGSGVEAQTITVWNQSLSYNLSNIGYINKMDKVGANFKFVLDSISKNFGVEAFPLTIPVGEGTEFYALIDFIKCQITFLPNDIDAFGLHQLIIEYQRVDHDTKLKDAKWRLVKDFLLPFKKDTNATDVTNLCHALDLFIFYRSFILDWLDDDLKTNKYVSFIKNFSIYTNDKIHYQWVMRHYIKEMMHDDAFSYLPVYAGSSKLNFGIKPLLDGIVNLLPFPKDSFKVLDNLQDRFKGKIIKLNQDILYALVFKVIVNNFLGKIAFIRVYSGSIKKSTYVFNITKKKKERISWVVWIDANKLHDIEEVKSGDICGIIGFKHTFVGDTISDQIKQRYLLEKIKVMDAVVSMAITPKDDKDKIELGKALWRLRIEDPNFHNHYKGSQIIISGMGGLHLDVMINRLKGEYNLNVVTSKPKVSFKESISSNIGSKKKLYWGECKKQTGGRGHYAKIGAYIVYRESLSKEQESNVFHNNIVEGSIPKNFIPGIIENFHIFMNRGFIMSSPINNVEFFLCDGDTHEVDSDDFAFWIALFDLLTKMLKNHKMYILEPIMKLEIDSPERYVGKILSLLSSRRCIIKDKCYLWGSKNVKITSLAPLYTIGFSFEDELKLLSSGMARQSLLERFSYERLPASLQDKLLKEYDHK